MPPYDGQQEGLPDGVGQVLHEGQVFAGYTILRRLGAGGMGEVYLAQHPRLPRRDALKVLPAKLTADPEFRQRFNREADLAANLSNQHIVGIYDRGEFHGRLWISMDYVEGTDAARLLRGRYPSGMPRADVVEIVSAVADALDYAHSRGLLHRDVKPANILLGDADPRRRILLADFGIARELGEISGLTATNMLVGTTAYCAPEQLQGLDPDGRADQYGLGCTAFNLLTGSAPFQHSNPAVLISQHLSMPAPPVSAQRPDLADLDAVIAKALAKNPDERYASCTDFAAALKGQASPGSTVPEGPTAIIATPTAAVAAPQSTSEAERPRSLRPALLIAALLAVALLAVAVVLGVTLLRKDTSQPGSPPSPTAQPTSATAPPTTPALRLSGYITDESGVLGPIERAAVHRALTRLYDERGIRLWVVYVNNFGGSIPLIWAQNTMRANSFTATDAILAIATDEPDFVFRVPDALVTRQVIKVELIRRERIRPAVLSREWARAAIAAANGLGATPG
ncbi:serine/threonine-protein kinase [Mycobacterium spongiae]|uniref:non-specific serine/threonine protein kinase n=1 Tax=Mycobacterium spongiae TaxID=886343 RepID=A0A975JXA2_9MYCO|nr:serine/threonine-protein kinase [Mycobacterium spongiae]QUR67389.1 protein kinase [Mycobacterium spongiae]